MVQLPPNYRIRRASERDRWLRVELEREEGLVAVSLLLAIPFVLLSWLPGEDGFTRRYGTWLFLFSLLLLVPNHCPILFSWNLSQFWVIEHQNSKIIGYAKIKRTLSATHIDSFYIAPNFRGQDFGSALLQHILQVEAKPIYVVSEKAGRFFQRYGFRDLSPEEGQPPISLIYEIPEPSEVDCRIRRANERDRWFQVEQRHSQPIPQAILLLVFSFVLHAWGDYNRILGTLFLLIALLWLYPSNYPFWLSRNLSQFWVIEHQNSRIIGYAKIDREANRTYINRFYIAPSFRGRRFGFALLQHIIQIEAKPICVFSPKAWRFFQRHGFRDWNPEEGLPPVWLIYETQESSDTSTV